MIGLIIYLVIGFILTVYWWKNSYKKSYEVAKASDEGTERGMLEMVLLVSLFLWPIVASYKFINKKIRK